MCDDTLDHHILGGGVLCAMWVETKDAIEGPIVHRSVPPQRDLSTQNVHRSRRTGLEPDFGVLVCCLQVVSSGPWGIIDGSGM